MGKSLFTTILFNSALAAWSNNVPIYGTYAGWIEGGNRVGISLELHYDLLCEDSKSLDSMMRELLVSEWLDGTVKDQIALKTTLYPLPYHPHTW